jgi:Transposase IS66 family
MKRQWAYKCTTAEERTGRLTSGNTVARRGQWCLISGSGAKGKGPSGSLEISKDSSRVTATVAMTEWADPKSCMQAVGRTPDVNFLIKLNPNDQTAIGIVALMDQLFVIDAQARTQKLSQSDRHLLRQQKAPPLLEQIKGANEAARVQTLPGSALAKGCNYTLTLWSRLTHFLDYPQLELSNNLAENAIRPVALGRKNWIHIGSEEAGPRVAAIISIVESCRRLNIPIRDNLGSVLPGLANRPISQTAELTPAAWTNRNTSATPLASSAV